MKFCRSCACCVEVELVDAVDDGLAVVAVVGLVDPAKVLDPATICCRIEVMSWNRDPPGEPSVAAPTDELALELLLELLFNRLATEFWLAS